MKAIYKFPLGDDKKTVIKIPKDAKILSVQEQFSEGVMWALVDTEKEVEERFFESFLTGKEIKLFTPNYIYLGTYQTDGGNFVVHVFEITNRVSEVTPF